MSSNTIFVGLCLCFIAALNLTNFIKGEMKLRLKEWVGALLSIAGLFYLTNAVSNLLIFGFYLGFIVLHYYIAQSKFKFNKHQFSVFLPILFIFIIKYTDIPKMIQGGGKDIVKLSAYFLGISYVSFKMSLFSHYLRVKKISNVSLGLYLSYILFLPSIMVGPITNPKVFFESFQREFKLDRKLLFLSIERIVYGLLKFTMISQFFFQATSTSHFPFIETNGVLYGLLSGFFYYMFLYFNFSGFCDFVVGVSALCGIEIQENFNRPLLSRNIKDFWARWHITLSNYMNEVIFAPLNLYFMRRVNRKHQHLVMVFVIFIVFVLIGYWHGKEEKFLYFGLLQAFAVALNYLYGVWLKKVLGAKGYKSYLKNKKIEVIAIMMTILYMTCSFVVFGGIEIK